MCQCLRQLGSFSPEGMRRQGLCPLVLPKALLAGIDGSQPEIRWRQFLLFYRPSLLVLFPFEVCRPASVDCYVNEIFMKIVNKLK